MMNEEEKKVLNNKFDKNLIINLEIPFYYDIIR